MRDVRNLQRPPGSKEAEEALSAYMSARTTALLFFHPSGAVTIGSSTNIRLGQYLFLATAAHNIDNLDQRTELRVSPYNASGAGITIIARSHPRTSKYDHDVAWLQVALDIENSGMAWLSINDLLCGQRFDPYEAFLIQGYPASEVIVRGKRGFDLFSLGVGCIPLPPDRGENFMTLEYPPLSPEDLGLELPSPAGLSDGGGVWTIPSFSGSSIWSPDATRLVAVGKSYDPERARLGTTPIEHWLSLVAQDFPELRGDIEAHLRESQPNPGVFISPNFRHPKLQDPTIEDLVDVLEDRLKFWLLEPAKKLASNKIEEVAAFNLLLSYFEGIWIYIQGRDSRSHSREFFEAAFVDVFRSGGISEALLRRVAQVFYEDARCGFFHDAMFRGRIFFGKSREGVIHVTLPRINGVIDENGTIQSIIVDVEGFYQYVEGHFRQLIARLRDPSQTELRSNCQAMCRQKWDYEGDPRVIVP